MRWLLTFALLAGCGDNKAAKPDDAGVDAVTPDAAVKLTGCLDSVGLPMAPNGKLPCDLIPPGLEL